jgi:urease accessory protein
MTMPTTATPIRIVMGHSKAPLLPAPPAEPEAVASSEHAALYRLMTWLSPSFPVGAFSYSSGIEWAVESGDINDADSLKQWLSAMLLDGAGFCDGVFLCHAWRSSAGQDDAGLADVAELAAAFTPSRERQLETTAQGRAFADIVRAAWPCDALERLLRVWPGPLPYPVAVGTVAAGHGIRLDPTLQAFLHAQTANWISAGVRLIPLGQTDSQRVLAALEPVVVSVASRATVAALDDLGSATFRADLASMHHETQYTRLFRS